MANMQHTGFVQMEIRTQTHKVAPPSTLSYGIREKVGKDAMTAQDGANVRFEAALLSMPKRLFVQPSSQLLGKCYGHMLVASLVFLLIVIVSGNINLLALSISPSGVVALIILNIRAVRKMANQIDQLQQENECALASMRKYLVIAETDSLTGLPNRLALKRNLANLTLCGSLTFIDIDGLKYYNDRFGHARGDELLRYFSLSLAKHLSTHAQLHRLGGDEFAITCASGEVAWIEQMLRLTVADMNANGFELVDASCGSAFAYETADKAALQHLADCRMYATKRLHKSVRHLNA